MKQAFAVLFVFIVFGYAVNAQKLVKPTKTPTQPTAEQQKVLLEGIKLHDAKKYDEAIAKYESVLASNPDCSIVMYELAMTLDAKGEKSKSIEIVSRGIQYISDELPLFYVLIANNLDDHGKPQEAIKIYQDGLKLLDGDIRFNRHRSSLFYNLGVTHVRQKNYAEARKALKSSVENDFSYASPHYLLSIVYNGTKYKVPALLAATRLISLEINSQRTVNAVSIVSAILKPTTKDEKTGNINIFLDLNAPKDEGDFGMFDLILGTVTSIRGDDDKNKTENEMFIEGLQTVFAILEEDKKIKNTFVGKTYVPFASALKKAGHLSAFGNIVIFFNDRNNDEAKKWIDSNGDKVTSFVNWAKNYKPTGH